MQKVKRFVGDVRTWLVLLSIIGAATLKVFGFLDLPKRVEAVEECSAENKTAVDSVADTLSDYIQVRKAIEVEREKSAIVEKELMHKWIEAVSTK